MTTNAVNRDTVQQAIQTLLRTMLGMADGSVRKANTTKAGPTGDGSLFATVFLSNFQGKGWDDQKFENTVGVDSTTVDETISGQRAVTASIQFMGPLASATANQVQGALQSSSSQYAMSNPATYGFTLGLGVIGGIRDLSALVDTLWQDRAQLDIEFFVIVEEYNTVETLPAFPFTIQHQVQQ
jgi:hypothetical protein